MVDGDELETIERRLHGGTVCQLLGTEGFAHRRIESLEETLRGWVEDRVVGRLDVQLRVLDEVRADAVDLRGRIGADVSVAVVVSGAGDLGIAQVGEDGGRVGLGGSVTVTVEDVDAQHGLCLGHGEAEEGGKEEEAGGRQHLDDERN